VRAQVPANRHRLLAQLLRERGSVTVADVEREFGVSPMTARRDLGTLEKQGLALRTYGGAMLPAAAAVEGSFDQRMGIDVAIKERLAAATLERVRDGETIFVDSSTAGFYATRVLLAAGRKLTIMTNSLPVLELLRRAQGIDVIALGGSFDPTGARYVGPDTVRVANVLLADKLIMSATGLTADGWLSDANRLEAEVKRTIVERSHESILLLTASELNRRGLSVFAHLKDVTEVLHTDDISPEQAQQLRKFTSNVNHV
jgi:DeoR/GlpR family transcriptional regulator of sugar metabolism